MLTEKPLCHGWDLNPRTVSPEPRALYTRQRCPAHRDEVNYLVIRVIEDGDDDSLAHAEGHDLDDGADLAEGLELSDFLLATDEPGQGFKCLSYFDVNLHLKKL